MTSTNPEPGDCEECPESDFEFCAEHAQIEIDELRAKRKQLETLNMKLEGVVSALERERDEARAKLAKSRLSRDGDRARAKHLEIERDQWKARAHESDERAGEARAKLAMYEAMPVVPFEPKPAEPEPPSAEDVAIPWDGSGKVALRRWLVGLRAGFEGAAERLSGSPRVGPGYRVGAYLRTRIAELEAALVKARPHVYRQLHGRHEQDRADAKAWLLEWEKGTPEPVSSTPDAAGLMHDRVHRDTGRSRVARTARRKPVSHKVIHERTNSADEIRANIRRPSTPKPPSPEDYELGASALQMISDRLCLAGAQAVETDRYDEAGLRLGNYGTYLAERDDGV